MFKMPVLTKFPRRLDVGVKSGTAFRSERVKGWFFQFHARCITGSFHKSVLPVKSTLSLAQKGRPKKSLTQKVMPRRSRQRHPECGLPNQGARFFTVRRCVHFGSGFFRLFGKANSPNRAYNPKRPNNPSRSCVIPRKPSVPRNPRNPNAFNPMV